MERPERIYVNLFILAAILFFGCSVSTLHLFDKSPRRDVLAGHQPKEPLSEKNKAGTGKLPLLKVDFDVFDAGEVWNGEKIRHTFLLKNNGEGNLEIKRVSPC